MLSFEILPWEGRTTFLVSYLDLTLKQHQDRSEFAVVARALSQDSCANQRKQFDTLENAKAFMDTYIEHLGLYLEKKPAPASGWIWEQKEKPVEVP